MTDSYAMHSETRSVRMRALGKPHAAGLPLANVETF